MNGSAVTVVAPDRPGLLWRAAGVLAAHRMAVRSASAASAGSTAVIEFVVVPEYGTPPDPATLEADLRLVLAGRLDIEQRLARRARSMRPSRVPVAPPRVTLVDDASLTASVVEVRAHDRPGLLWRIGVLSATAALTYAPRVWRLWAQKRWMSSMWRIEWVVPFSMSNSGSRCESTCLRHSDDVSNDPHLLVTIGVLR